MSEPSAGNSNNPQWFPGIKQLGWLIVFAPGALWASDSVPWISLFGTPASDQSNRI